MVKFFVCLYSFRVNNRRKDMILCFCLFIVPGVSIYFKVNTEFCMKTEEVPGEKYHLYI